MDIETIIREGMRRYRENETKTFCVIINNSKEERRYNDILRVHYWISRKTGRITHKVYMKNEEVFTLENDPYFDKSCVPMGINNVEQVRLKRYLWANKTIISIRFKRFLVRVENFQDFAYNININKKGR